MDKDRAHRLVATFGINVPKGIVVNKDTAQQYINCESKKLKYPLFIKPVKSGSSLGISKINYKSDLLEAVKMALNYDNEVIVEENIEGFEVGCAVLGNNELMLGRVDEIELTQGFFDYNEKYSLESSKVHMPARVDTQTEEQIKEVAVKIYKILDCSGFARVDMFLTKEKNIVFNEFNTIPGFTSHSRYPNMMKGMGLSYKEILDTLIQTGI